VTVVEQANNRQGGSEQGKGCGREALTTEEGHHVRSCGHCNKNNTTTTRGGLAVRATHVGVIKQSTAQLRNQDSEKQPGGSCSKSDGKSYEQLWSEQGRHRKRLRLGLQELMRRC